MGVRCPAGKLRNRIHGKVQQEGIVVQAIFHLPTLVEPHRLWASLRRAGLLTQAELENLEAFQGNAAAVVAAVNELTASGRLTAFQREILLAGEGEHLCLGQYRIRDRLGAGGMGQVYLAEHVVMDRLVALKVIADRFLSDAEAMRRFRREVRIAARLNHPNIVQAHDAAEAGGRHFLVMEYVKGVQLDCLLNELGPLPEPLACRLMHQAALALQHAADQGLTHGDIKPANMLVTKDSTLKVLDFGLARWIRSSREGDNSPIGSDDETVAGTPDFLSPEVARDPRLADIRSDLYSLGCTFYFALSGQPPYPSGSWPEALLRHQKEAIPDVQACRTDVSEECCAIVMRLMAKSPGDRFQTPKELALALEDLNRSYEPAAYHIPSSVWPGSVQVQSQASAPTLPSIKPPPRSEKAPKWRPWYSLVRALRSIASASFIGSFIVLVTIAVLCCKRA